MDSKTLSLTAEHLDAAYAYAGTDLAKDVDGYRNSTGMLGFSQR